MKDASELKKHLAVTKINQSKYEGSSLDFGNPFVYGGQFLGQSLNAAYQEIENDKFAHSLHAQFFKPGNFDLPIQYLVEKINDSNSFSVRYVKAIQNEEVIYACTVSFKKEEKNLFQYQAKKPFLFRTPNLLISQETFAKLFKKQIPKKTLKFLSIERPFTAKPVEFERFMYKIKRKPKRNIWYKFKNPSKNKFTIAEKQQMLLYLSDFGILFASLDPFPKVVVRKIIMPTISHSIWFHKDFIIDDDLLFSYECKSTTNAKSFTNGDFFSRNGDILASVSQEGLLRIKNNGYG